MRECSICFITKEDKDFQQKNGTQCRACLSEIKRKLYQKNKKGKSEHNEYSYAIGMVIGEYKGLSRYTK